MCLLWLALLQLSIAFHFKLNTLNSNVISLYAKKGTKVRVDDLLVSQGLVESKDQALRLILARNVLIREGEIVQSPADLALSTDKLRLKGVSREYVSRSALKLEHAVKTYNLQEVIQNATCIDIGSSTGGFTQILLQHDARKVYAVDVGVSLLDYKIRSHPNVVVLEKVNARYLSQEEIPDAGKIGIIVCDVSFISLRLVLPPAMAMAQVGAVLVALIKPQFECARDALGEGGILRDESVRQQVVDDILDWFESAHVGWSVKGTCASPITGTHGNQEYLLVATRDS